MQLHWGRAGAVKAREPGNIEEPRRLAVCDPKDVRRLLSLGVGGGGRGWKRGARFLGVCVHSSVVGEEKRCSLDDPSEFSPERPLSPKDSSRRERPTAEERVHRDPHAGEAQARSPSKGRALSLSFFSRKISVLLSGQEEEGEAERQSVLVAHPSFPKRLQLELICVPKRSISGCPIPVPSPHGETCSVPIH